VLTKALNMEAAHGSSVDTSSSESNISYEGDSFPYGKTKTPFYPTSIFIQIVTNRLFIFDFPNTGANRCLGMGASLLSYTIASVRVE
jgi:hypothetical protein